MSRPYHGRLPNHLRWRRRSQARRNRPFHRQVKFTHWRNHSHCQVYQSASVAPLPKNFPSQLSPNNQRSTIYDLISCIYDPTSNRFPNFHHSSYLHRHYYRHPAYSSSLKELKLSLGKLNRTLDVAEETLEKISQPASAFLLIEGFRQSGKIIETISHL